MKSLHKKYLDNERNRIKFQNEIHFLTIMNHKNIIKLYETFNANNLMLIIMELCGGGDLLGYVRKRKVLSEPIVKIIFKQVLLYYK